MKKVAVILSGCGFYDGAEIHESVLSLLAIEQNGASWHCFAPDIDQFHVVNHAAGEEMATNRNVLQESARIARGNIQAISELNPDHFDALLLPGGFGVAKNLSSFASKGVNLDVDENVLRVCKAFATAEKPAGYICISPILIPSVYGNGAKGTIGNDPEVSAAFNAWVASTLTARWMISCWIKAVGCFPPPPICWQPLSVRPMQGSASWYKN